VLVEIPGELGRLGAPHGLLHLGVGVLHAHRDAVEAQLAQLAQVIHGGHDRVDLYGDFRVGQEIEGIAQPADHVTELFGLQVGGRATTEVQPAHSTLLAEFGSVEPDVLFKDIHVGDGHFVLWCDDHVATAVEATALAERNMHVEGERRCLARVVALCVVVQRLLHAVGIELTPGRSRGIAGVARSRPIVFLEQALEIGIEDFPRRGRDLTHAGLPCVIGL